MILKFRKNISEWYSLYANAIKNRLRRDLNLSDVCDVQETRDNIGLSGDNNHTHYHDDRYIPIIEKRINELDNKVNNLIPIGTIMTWPSNVPPDTYRWLECNGQSFNPTEFPDLYKVFPSGKVPDLREKFLEGYRIAGNDISPGLPGWYHYAGNILTFGSNYGYNKAVAFIGGGGQVQPINAESHRWRECVMDVNIGGFSTKATHETLATGELKNIPITVSGSYTDGEGHSHGVTLTGSLPVYISKYRIGLWQQLVCPTTGIADAHFQGYSDNADGMLSSGYARGHELYGKASTVQPKSYTVIFYVRAK